MEKYKGYILSNRSTTYENRSYNGHRNEGDGTYTTKYYVEILNPDTLKTTTADSIDMAKNLIDKWTSSDAETETEMTKRLIGEWEKKKVDALLRRDKIDAEVIVATKEIIRLRRDLPPAFFNDKVASK